MPVKDEEFIPTRASLLSRLKNWDDQESWKVFFDTYWKMLYSVAKRSGLNDSEAQDVVQETIVAAAKQIPNFHYDPAIGSFKSWLMLIIRRRIIDFLRKQGNARQRQQVPIDPATATAGATDTMARIPDPAGDQINAIYEEEWQQHILEIALQKVRQEVAYEQFQMFDCYALKGWAVEEVAQRLNVTVSAVYNAKYRISRLIKEEVQRLEEKMI
jgi:RNA polymerase sigma-70 factor (ECF subfamily)